MTINKNKGTVQIYGCGGTGVKLASMFADAKLGEGYADIGVTYIDTSTSDLPATATTESCFLTQDTDGSGSKRDANLHTITDACRQIPTRFKPKDLNIVVASGIGGTGSLFGPLLTRELLQRDAVTVVILVISTTSARAIQNCIDTIKTYAGQSRLADKPIVLMIHNNGENTNKADVDKAVHSQVLALSILASRAHEGVDTSDIANLFNFTTVTSVGSQLATMDILDDVVEANKVSFPVAVASLNAEGTRPVTVSGADYQFGGTMTQEYNDVTELHYVVSVSELTKVVKHLNDAMQKVKSDNSGRPSSVNLTDDNDRGDGLVFS